jgi:D-alanyl-D-alanine carboxypeptidase
VGALLEPPRARFTGAVGPVPPSVAERMRGRSWKPDDARCPRLDGLAHVEVDHVDFTGAARRGELVVARAIGDATVALFARLFAIGFPIRSLRLIDELDADDDRSMAADNSSAFNFRVVAGTQVLSQHAHGLAIDLNPVENPWVTPASFVPAAGEPYLDRARIRPGMLVRPGPVVAILDELGWEWGGDWRHASDYHHVVKR